MKLGGLGLSSEQQASLTAAHGAVQATLLLVAFTPLHRRFGTQAILVATGICFAASFLWNPVLNVLAGKASRALYQGGLVFGLLLNSLQNLAFRE